MIQQLKKGDTHIRIRNDHKKEVSSCISQKFVGEYVQEGVISTIVLEVYR